MNALVELEDVVKMFGGEPALGPLSLRLEGNVVGILGPNGAGKSTMIRLMLGLLEPTAGTVALLGKEVAANDPEARRRIGYVPEGEALFPDLTGVEAVAFAGRLSGMPAGLALQRAHEVLDYVELGEERYRNVDRYSSGMRQRLKLAQALVHDPDLLILDEPTEAVDPETRRHLLRMLKELAAGGIRMIITTHLLADLDRIADHAIVLRDGRLAAQGSLEELKAAKSSMYQLRVNGDFADVTRILDAKSIKWAHLGTSIQVEITDPGALLAMVREAGLVVRHLTPVERSLEDAFEDAVLHAPDILPARLADDEERKEVTVDG